VFGQQSTEFLGHILNAEGIHPLPDKLKAISEWPQPTSVKDVQSCLGLANYYRRFVPRFAEISSPLSDLTKHDTPFLWDERCDKALETLKSLLCTAPKLRLPDLNRQVIINTDASDFAVSAVLQQQS